MFGPSKKISYFALIAIFLLTILATFFLRSTPHFAHILLTSPSQVQVNFIWQASASKTLCQKRLVTLNDSAISICPDCKVQQRTCLAILNEAQKTALLNKPMDFPSIVLHDGLAYFQSLDPQLALKTCLASAKYNEFGHILACEPAHTLDPYTKASLLNLRQEIKEILISLSFAALISWVVCLLIVRNVNLKNQLNANIHLGVQKIHVTPTPRIGGIAIFTSLLCSLMLEMTFHIIAPNNPFSIGFFLLAGLPVFFAGVLEDLTNNVGVRHRLIFSALSAAVGVLLFGFLINRIDIGMLDSILILSPIAIAFTILGVSGLANATNIIDGYNGLSAGYAVIALTAMTYVAFQLNDHLIIAASISLIGALLGFLYWNWPHGKLFMGDGGAYLLGFTLAELAVVMLGRNPMVSPWFTALIMAYPVFETLFTIFRRLSIKKHSGDPDASHLHHLIYFKLLRAHQFSDPKKITQLNSRVALLLLLPAVLAAILACLFWHSTAILMPLTLAGCVIYPLVYRKLLSLPD